ncbi:DUF6537 domain-containing protein [Streptomyces sp. NPDC033753]|uniref:DUF6537 domain-containing protein n=2 Tax=unclassified Streptomyces TaxID=2593676 RepID=UPI0033CAA7E1
MGAAIGMTRKIELGPWFKPALRALAAMRRLRGTRLDPFGAAHVRRTERALIVEYEATITEVCRNLDERGHGPAVDIASLPDTVRGYEEIKMASVARYRARSAELVGRLSSTRERTAADSAASRDPR